MKRQPKGAKQKAQTLRVWAFAEAETAVPYITSVVRSIREHALEALSQARTAQRLDERPGRPDRNTLIAQQEAREKARKADEEFRRAVHELQELDIYVLDPIQGQALVPFVHDEQLAWYVFDLFDAVPLRFWRFQTDPEDTRRPITPRQKGPFGSTQVV